MNNQQTIAIFFETPVLTAGKTFILGYTDETDKIYKRGVRLALLRCTLQSRYITWWVGQNNAIIQDWPPGFFVKCADGMVTFGYVNSKTKRCQTRTVTGEYFLWLIMQHVLPKGFRRVRSYGFLHACSKQLIKLLQVSAEI